MMFTHIDKSGKYPVTLWLTLQCLIRATAVFKEALQPRIIFFFVYMFLSYKTGAFDQFLSLLMHMWHSVFSENGRRFVSFLGFTLSLL